MLEQILYAYLMSVAGLVALIADRLYPSDAPQGIAGAYVVYRRISGPRTYDFDGPSGLVTARMQFSVLAPSYLQAKAVAEQLRLALEDFADDTVIVCRMLNEIDTYESETRLHHVIVDFGVTYKE